MSRHLNVRLPAARLPADTGGPPHGTIGVPSCRPSGGINTKWSGNSCAVHPTERCVPRWGIGIDWLSNKCATLHEEPARAAPPSTAQPAGANLHLVSSSVQPANNGAHPWISELGWGVALALGAVFVLGWARHPLLRALALVRQWATRGRYLQIAARPAVPAVVEPAVSMVPAEASMREPVAAPGDMALVSDGKVNALLEELGSDDETAARALLQLYARGGWLKWEELLPQDVPAELRDKLVSVCRNINGSLDLAESRAALAQARQMLKMHRIAVQPTPA